MYTTRTTRFFLAAGNGKAAVNLDTHNVVASLKCLFAARVLLIKKEQSTKVYMQISAKILEILSKK